MLHYFARLERLILLIVWYHLFSAVPSLIHINDTSPVSGMSGRVAIYSNLNNGNLLCII